MAVLTNYTIMSGKSKGLFRHLENKNPSIISDSKGKARMVQQFQRSQSIGGVGFDHNSVEVVISH